MSPPIYVTQPYLPPIEKYFKYIRGAFDRNVLTNNGPLVQELTERLKKKLGVEHLLLVNNGTIALQIAYNVKKLSKKNVITTPYTFAATSTALDWQGANTVLAEVDEKSWNITPESVEEFLSTGQGDAIVAVNLFGQPCELEKLDSIAQRYNAPLIYDSAHALFSTYQNKSVFDYGDIHCISFHATKLFHCVEGGAMTFKNEEEYILAKKLINFGMSENGDIEHAGINGKLSEIHAAMGLCVLDDLDDLINERESLIYLYKKLLANLVVFQQAEFNHYTQPIYMPIKFPSEELLIKCLNALNNEGYYPRRYFMPQNYKFLPKSQNSQLNKCNTIAKKIMCLPLMNGLNKDHVKKICKIISTTLKKH